MKMCSKCKSYKDKSLFSPDNRTPSGLQSQCRECQKIAASLLSEEKKEKRAEAARIRARLWHLENRERSIASKKKWRCENIEKKRNSDRQYYYENKEKIIEYNRSYNSTKYKEDHTYRLGKNIGHRIRMALSSVGYTKKSRTTEIIGCDLETLKAHISRQFLKGMTWGNRRDWHIDHIIPLSKAETEDDVVRLNHYTNLRPLWAKDNLEKGDRDYFLI